MTDLYGDFSDFYDLYVSDWLDDLTFYLEYAQPVETPILELGAGSGRLTLPLAQAGHRVVAVDLSRSMLARLQSRLAQSSPEVQQRVQILQADLCEVALAKAFDLILVPFYAFNYLLTPERQKQALNTVAAHLTVKGNALIDVFLPLRHIRQCPDEPVLRVNRRDETTGNDVRGWNRYAMDTERNVETRIHRFEITPPSGAAYEREFTTQRRYFFPEELESLFTDAGLAIEAGYSGYKREPVTPNSEQMLYVVRLASSE